MSNSKTETHKFDIDGLRVASPCNMPWDAMMGSDRVRNCASCKLNVFNISEMTAVDVEQLVLDHEGRLCIRLYKRTDGTVITKDCPVGFKAYQKRVARFAGAVLTSVLGLFSISFGQKEDQQLIDASKINSVKSVNQNGECNLSGIITDPNGAVIPKATIRLYKTEGKKRLKDQKRSVEADFEGSYCFSGVLAGNYEIEISSEHFKTAILKNLIINAGKSHSIDIKLEVSVESVTVGILGNVELPIIDTTSSGVTTTITKRKIETIPH